MGNKQGARTASRRKKSGRTNSSWHPGVKVEATTNMARILRRQSCWKWISFIVIILVGNPVFAQIPDASSDDLLPGQMNAGSLLLRMEAGYVVATRMNTDIDTTISGLVARVRVRQEFRNSGPDWVEGVYVFPLPDTAAVDHLRMHIGERYIEGEIREKEQAKKDYAAAKAAGQKASLVEQERANLFTSSVANIGPGETVSVEIEYLETLRFDEGTFSLRFPLTLTPRYIPGTRIPDRKGSGWSPDTTSVSDASRITPPVVTASNDHSVTFHAELNAGVPLEYVASRYHPINVNQTDDRYTIDLQGPDAAMDHDLEINWKPVPDSAPRAMMFTESMDGRSVRAADDVAAR